MSEFCNVKAMVRRLLPGILRLSVSLLNRKSGRVLFKTQACQNHPDHLGQDGRGPYAPDPHMQGISEQITHSRIQQKNAQDHNTARITDLSHASQAANEYNAHDLKSGDAIRYSVLSATERMTAQEIMIRKYALKSSLLPAPTLFPVSEIVAA